MKQILWAPIRYLHNALIINTRSIAQEFRNRHFNKFFDGYYLDNQEFFLNRFGKVPCVTYITEVKDTKAFTYINDKFKDRLMDTFKWCWYDRKQQKQRVHRTLFVIRHNLIIEIRNNIVEVLFTGEHLDLVNEVINQLSEFKIDPKKDAFEINIITRGRDGLELKQLNIKKTDLDIDLYYNDDFKPVDELIRARLNKQEDKGIILLHGLPGTGKTTYLRQMVGTINKKVLFISPSVADNLMNPEFLDLLIDHPNSVLVIEDAENIIMDRQFNSNSSVSNLLNLSDGIMSDCLNVQIICTFNNPLSMVDSALLRKGRLIARYEFGTLGELKAQRLSDSLGLNQVIRKAMTLAEITNPDVCDYGMKTRTAIGFNTVSSN